MLSFSFLKKNIFFGLFIILIVIIVSTGVYKSQNGEFTMFSFFSRKKNIPAPTTINPIVGATLKEEIQLPDFDSIVKKNPHCRKLRYEGKPPNTKFVTERIVETPDSAFVIDGLSEKKTLALINNPDEGRFDIWNLEASILRPTTQIDIGNIHPRQNKWNRFFILDVACLSNNKILIAMGYKDPTAKYALFLFDVSKSNISYVADIDRNFPEIQNYFEYRQLTNEASLVLYYSDTKRESAEIYHNYYNHLRLFNSEYPQGVEILKLGIDIGNITEWTVQNKILFMRTIDTRDVYGRQEPKRGAWSLNLSNLLK